MIHTCMVDYVSAVSQEHAAISAALGLKPGEAGVGPHLMGGLGRTFTPEPMILQELQLVEERIAGAAFIILHDP